MTEIRNVAEGFWIWRIRPEAWPTGLTSTCVACGGEVLLLDASAPLDDGAELWRRLDAMPPTALVVLKPDHVRDIDLFAQRYDVPAYGPWLFQRDDVPATELEPIEPGSVLPGGPVALYDGRGRGETPLWLPEQRTLVFADALLAPHGDLRVWDCPSLAERALPALRAMLSLPFERVLVSHGEPLHDRAAFERALELPALQGD